MTLEMIKQLATEPIVGIQQARYIRGEVYTSKKCKKLAPMKHGQTGFRVVCDSNDPAVQEVFCDAKSDEVLWLAREEFEASKQERSKKWLRENWQKSRTRKNSHRYLIESRWPY